VVQGLAELLPVSSSAHVIVAEKLMGMNPAAPESTLLLVMLHTGTMFAVIAYFWKRWSKAFFQSAETFWSFVLTVLLATALTIMVGGGLTKAIEKIALHGKSDAWVEELFGRLELIAGALAAVGVLILIAGLREKQANAPGASGEPRSDYVKASWIGVVQGLCLPFRGFSRSGATISTGILVGVPKLRAEDFSFALAVVLTPLAIARELLRLFKTHPSQSISSMLPTLTPSLLGAGFAFLTGLLALKWLSRWLETGRWYWFGIYCLVAAATVGFLHHAGY
jgi:undecaprenyl-diphosphatase